MHIRYVHNGSGCVVPTVEMQDLHPIAKHLVAIVDFSSQLIVTIYVVAEQGRNTISGEIPLAVTSHLMHWDTTGVLALCLPSLLCLQPTIAQPNRQPCHLRHPIQQPWS